VENRNGLTRRSVLCGAAVLALGTLPEKAIAASGLKVLANGKLEISLASNPALKKVGGVVEFQDGNGMSYAVVRTSKAVNGFKAMSLSCTHNGCTVRQNGSNWVCPCHGAQYALSGKVKIGPAPRDLVSIPVKATSTKLTVG